MAIMSILIAVIEILKIAIDIFIASSLVFSIFKLMQNTIIWVIDKIFDLFRSNDANGENSKKPQKTANKYTVVESKKVRIDK